MENKKTTDQTQQNKGRSIQSTGTSGKSQSQTNPQKDREQNIVNEQDQSNPVNPQEQMSDTGSNSSGDYSSEKDMNRGQQGGLNWGQQSGSDSQEGV